MTTISDVIIFASMSENNRRLIFAIIFLFLLIPVLLGYVGMWISKVMQWQGRKMDTLLHDVVVTKVITDKQHLKKYGNKKNLVTFFRQAWIPFLVMLAAVIILLITDACVEEGFSYNPFNNTDGVGTLLWHWDWSSEDIWVEVWGIRMIGSWPELVSSPHFVGKAVGSYLFFLCASVGFIYWLIIVQCYLSRWWRLRHLCESIYSKSLEGYKQDDHLTMTANTQAITKQNLTGGEASETTNSNANQRPPLGG